MRGRNAGGAAQADPSDECSLLGSYSYHVQGVPGMMTGTCMEETASPPVTRLPITTVPTFFFSIFLLHRFVSNAIIY